MSRRLNPDQEMQARDTLKSRMASCLEGKRQWWEALRAAPRHPGRALFLKMLLLLLDQRALVVWPPRRPDTKSTLRQRLARRLVASDWANPGDPRSQLVSQTERKTIDSLTAQLDGAFQSPSEPEVKNTEPQKQEEAA